MYYNTLNHLSCPICMEELAIDEVLSESVNNGQQDIIEGFLACRGDVDHTFVIVDGVALLVEDFTRYLEGKQNVLSELIHAADTAQAKTFIADCLGEVNQLQSDTWESLYTAYIWAHFDSIRNDDLITEALLQHGVSGTDSFSTTHLTDIVRSFLPRDLPSGSIGIDIGCSVGGNTHSLADSVSTAIGCDYSFRAVRTARAIRDSDGEYEYDAHLEGYLRRTRSINVEIPDPETTDFVVADAAALPFGPETATVVVSMNMVDVLADPLDHLEAGDRLLSPGGRLIVCDPYDWARVSNADPANWFGGTDADDPSRSEEAIRRVISAHLGHEIVAEQRDVPWTLKYHPRSYSTWIIDCIASKKSPET